MTKPDNALLAGRIAAQMQTSIKAGELRPENIEEALLASSGRGLELTGDDWDWIVGSCQEFVELEGIVKGKDISP